MTLYSSEKYGSPTFRFCAVCDYVNKIRPEYRDGIINSLSDEWVCLFRELSAQPKRFRFNEIVHSENELAISDMYQEGPTIMFPEFSAVLLSNYRTNVRLSLTVCEAPRHSKLWIRITLNNRPNDITIMDIENFFNEAKDAGSKIINELFIKYSNTLQKHGFIEKLERIHDIQIETLSQDLDMDNLFEGELFSISSILKDNDRVKSLNGFLKLAFGKEIGNIQDVQKLSEEYKWFKMRFGMPDLGEVIGVYLVRSEGKSTLFSGLVQEPIGNRDCDISKVFSKYLVNHIAPAI